MSIDLEMMSLQELKSLQAQVAKAIANFAEKRKRQALAEVEETARRLGYSLVELTAGTPVRRRGAVAAKYANPADLSQTWSGRGRRPRWVDAALRSGKPLEDLAI